MTEASIGVLGLAFVAFSLAEQILLSTTATVLFSTVLHGLSAALGTNSYSRRCQNLAQTDAAENRKVSSMPTQLSGS